MVVVPDVVVKRLTAWSSTNSVVATVWSNYHFIMKMWFLSVVVFVVFGAYQKCDPHSLKWLWKKIGALVQTFPIILLSHLTKQYIHSYNKSHTKFGMLHWAGTLPPVQKVWCTMWKMNFDLCSHIRCSCYEMTKCIMHIASYNTKMSVKCYNNHNTFERYDLVAIIELVAPTCILAPKNWLQVI